MQSARPLSGYRGEKFLTVTLRVQQNPTVCLYGTRRQVQAAPYAVVLTDLAGGPESAGGPDAQEVEKRPATNSQRLGTEALRS